ncbi:FAD:protein FMN transferase [Desulfitibacter alkalitolerans]|uniref:FAD:protein FMN transferase n=1 Tax=Desulfitibacter alkalitolerans TaxID=264641 RepID=UPI000487DFD6|nr:FAD:protein FMN transferase [Desulfitibacter alkalitolerans]
MIKRILSKANLKGIKIVLIVVIIIFVVQGCTNKGNNFHSMDFFAMDTVFSITVQEQYAAEAEEASKIALHLHKLWDFNKEDSDLYRINNYSDLKIPVSPLTYEIIEEALNFAKKTEGAFDPTIQALMELWNFQKGTIPEREAVEALLPVVNYAAVALDKEANSVIFDDPETKLTLGGIAKGFAVREMVNFLKNKQVTSALVSAGGNQYALGTKPDGLSWKIGVRHPREKELTLGYVELSDMAIDTSGDYERFFEHDGIRYHHILNPTTGYPARGLIAVTVLAEDPVKADVLSTALLVMGLEKARVYHKSSDDFEMILVTEDLQIFITSGLVDTFQPARGIEVSII